MACVKSSRTVFVKWLDSRADAHCCAQDTEGVKFGGGVWWKDDQISVAVGDALLDASWMAS